MIGEMIKYTRHKRYFTQEEFAARLGINRATLSKYESNTIEPSSSMIIAISKELGVPVSFLFGESSNQVLTLDFQNNILETVQKRLSFLIDESDPEDFFAVHQTYDPYDYYKNIFNPELPVSLADIDDAADIMGTTREYLLGAIDDSSYPLEHVSNDRLLLKMINVFSILNDSGKVIAIERVKELTEISKYRNPSLPNMELSESIEKMVRDGEKSVKDLAEEILDNSEAINLFSNFKKLNYEGKRVAINVTEGLTTISEYQIDNSGAGTPSDNSKRVFLS